LSQPTNPFAAAVAGPPPEQQAPQAAPVQQYAPQPQAAPAAPPQGNPFGAGVPQQAPQPAQAAPAPPNSYPQPQYGQLQQQAAQMAQPYAPPAPNYAGSPYNPSPVQQYAPQQQAAPAGPPPQALDPSLLRGAPTPVVGEGRGAKLVHMYGRLVLIFPLSITRKPRSPQFITADQRNRGDLDQEQVTATFVVLDDGQGGMQPIRFGGDPSAFPAVPDNESAPLPYVRKGLWVTQSRVIGQLRDSLPAGPGQPGGMVCGRMVKTGPQRNDPWYVTTATEQELALAQQYMQLVAAGTYPHPLA
jgi:hypothetical protein